MKNIDMFLEPIGRTDAGNEYQSYFLVPPRKYMYPCFNESERFCEEPYAGKPYVRICEELVSQGACLLD